MTLLCLDTETTGLTLDNHCIWQISGIFKKGDQEERFNFKMRPFRGDPIESGAFIKTGVTQEELETYPDQKEALDKFITLLNKYGTAEDGSVEKIHIIGYNVKFDLDFINQWFDFNGIGRVWWKHIWWPYVDVMSLAATYYMTKRSEFENFKLGTVYRYVFGKNFENAHSADADVEATWDLFRYLYSRMVISTEIKTRQVNK